MNTSVPAVAWQAIKNQTIEEADLSDGKYGIDENWDKDPNKSYAQITRDKWESYLKDYRPFEEKLLDRAASDTGIIDKTRANVAQAPVISQGIADRNRQRLGANLTPAQIAEQSRLGQINSSLGGVHAMNNAYVGQKESNEMLRSDVYNIGNDRGRASLGALQQAAMSATQRKNQYTMAKAQHKAQQWQTVGALGSMAAMAYMAGMF